MTKLEKDYAQMYEALKRITKYMSPESLKRRAPRHYGLDGDEAVEMAYDNVLCEAKDGLKGVRKPKVG